LQRFTEQIPTSSAHGADSGCWKKKKKEVQDCARPRRAPVVAKQQRNLAYQD